MPASTTKATVSVPLPRLFNLAGVACGRELTRKDQRLSSGLVPLDHLLEGGLVRGRITETLADYAATGLTRKPHLLAHLRAPLKAASVLSTTELALAEHGAWVKVAGAVIVRQRPTTAKGFLFLSLEDENGIANVVVTPGLFERHRALLSRAALLQVEGPLQKVEGVIHIRARRFRELTLPAQLPPVRNFH
jgi:hypothetical protein